AARRRQGPPALGVLPRRWEDLDDRVRRDLRAAQGAVTTTGPSCAERAAHRGRRRAEAAPERCGEMAVAGVPEVEREVHERRAVGQAFERPVETKPVPVGMQRGAGDGTERAAEVECRKAGLARERIETDALTERVREHSLDVLDRVALAACRRARG